MRPRLILSRVPLLMQQIGLGVLLGLIQLLLFFLSLSCFGMYVALNLSFIPGLVLYLGLAVVAGFLTAHREERASAGARAGLAHALRNELEEILSQVLTVEGMQNLRQ